MFIYIHVCVYLCGRRSIEALKFTVSFNLVVGSTKLILLLQLFCLVCCLVFLSIRSFFCASTLACLISLDFHYFHNGFVRGFISSVYGISFWFPNGLYVILLSVCVCVCAFFLFSFRLSFHETVPVFLLDFTSVLVRFSISNSALIFFSFFLVHFMQVTFHFSLSLFHL